MLLYPRLRHGLPTHEYNNTLLTRRIHRAHNTLHKLALRANESEVAQIDVLTRRGVRAWLPKESLVERPRTDEDDCDVRSGGGRDGLWDIRGIG